MYGMARDAANYEMFLLRRRQRLVRSGTSLLARVPRPIGAQRPAVFSANRGDGHGPRKRCTAVVDRHSDPIIILLMLFLR
jgi:hypothetical protein